MMNNIQQHTRMIDEKKKDFEIEIDSLKEEIHIDKELEKKYVRTLDFRLLPFLALMYFFNSMDRSNLSNAYSDGFADDMHFKGQEYSLLLLLYYIPNSICDLPLNIMTKKFGAKLVLPSTMLIWGALSMIQAACENFGGMLTLRLLIGASEAGFFAGVIFYLTLFYTRDELALRISLFFGSALVSAAFTGLIAYGVFQVKNSLWGWQLLFIIEGGATVLISLFGYFWLSSTPATCYWLSPELKEIARLRHLKKTSNKVDTHFSFQECKDSLRCWHWWVYACIAFTYSLPWTTSSLFLTQIIQGMGFSIVKTNLYTVAPNCVGVVVLVLVCFSSDYFKERTYHISFSLALSIIALIILASVDSEKYRAVSYFACFLLCAGAYIPSALVHSWHNNNNLSESSRAFNSGVYVGLSNLSPIIVSATFRTQYLPRYVPTIIATCISAAICLVLVLSLGVWQKLQNRKKDKRYDSKLRAEDVDTNTLTNYSDPNWRFFT